MSSSHAPVSASMGAASKDLQTLFNEHANGWHQFTRFVKAGSIAMVLLLLMFALHFPVGWGFAMFLLVISYIALIAAMIMGKV